MSTTNSTARWFLVLIIASYLTLGTLYAVQTPKWQTPDEPAHFNYIQYIAQRSKLPILQPGDYPHQYLEKIKAAGFPPSMSISPIRYESHQPPLYYMLEAIVYRLTSGLPFDFQFLALRLFSVLLGALALITAYRLVHDIFPDNAFLALATTAFIAVLPMHLAISAAINNDILAELLLWLILWQSIHTLQEGPGLRQAMVNGILLGLALLTKTTIYAPAVITAGTATILSRDSQHKQANIVMSSKVRYLLCTLAMALVIAIPWFTRNALLYGALDIFGWHRHSTVVVGQLRSADLLAQIGPTRLAQRFLLTTFRSFWAQFGWMGVLVDQRIYLALALLSGMLGVGFLLFLIRLRQSKVTITAGQKLALTLLGINFLIIVLQYLGYNLSFVQHQGRYLFPALPTIALAAGLGLQELLHSHTARVLAIALLLGSLLLLAYGLLGSTVSKWSVVLLLAGAAFCAGAAWLPQRWQWLPAVLLYSALLALDLVCLMRYIVPYLS